MATKIVTKNSSTGGSAPSASDLVQGELAVNVTDGRLYTENASAAIVELGVNPTAEIQANAGVAFPTTQKAEFRDSAIYINSSADGQLDIVADTEIQIAATTVDINGNADVSGTLGVGGSLTVGSNLSVISSDTYAVFKIRTDANDDGSNDDGIIQITNGSSDVVKAELRWDESTNTVELGHGDNQGHLVIDSRGAVGLGTVPPTDTHATWSQLFIGEKGSLISEKSGSGGLYGTWLTDNMYLDNDTGAFANITTDESSAYLQEAGAHRFYSQASGSAGAGITLAERMLIDSSGNVGIGSSVYEGSVTSNASSVWISSAGYLSANINNDFGLMVNRTGTNGTLANFRKNGANVGGIGTDASGNLQTLSATGNYRFGDSNTTRWSVDSIRLYPLVDDTYNLGLASLRLNDIYATNATINTSDRNDKQDIEELNTAETAVAVACKGLLRKFRWKDAVAEKGDDARIHFGIIAQDLQAAFEAQGLDAGRYAMFTSSTWWETQTEVDAVVAVEAVEFVQAVEASEAIEAVYDEEGELVSEAVEAVLAVEGVEAVEAVEAKDAYTRTDTFDTLAEAPTGATERTRLGVRYPELLAFIISAI